MTAGPVTSTAAWEDANSASPPACAQSATDPQYEISFSTATTGINLIYIGGELPDQLLIPWIYYPEMTDTGATFHVSINSGSSWSLTTLALPSQGLTTSGTVTVDLNGATVLLVRLSAP